MPKAKYADRGKPKPKSIKTKKILTGERQAKRSGKKQKKGHDGVAAEYIARTKAIKRMQITIKDFRRICILKGIFPRDPPHKRNLDPSQTYYHYKDIQFLMHEPILNKFREHKTFMKKFARAVGRREITEAKHLYENRPMYTLDTIIRERYPRFMDVLSDLDDSLSMIHMFAVLPAEAPIKSEHTLQAKRLVREWQYYIARSRALRKIFFSIKGIYYQAEVHGVMITWLQPWQFSQALPTDVDYKVMLTFLELYDSILRFTMFKLYTDNNLAYPPNIVTEADNNGAFLTALDISKKDTNTQITSLSSQHISSLSMPSLATNNKTMNPEMVARMASLKSQIKSITNIQGATGDESSTHGTLTSSSSLSTTTKVKSSSNRNNKYVPSTNVYDFVDADIKMNNTATNTTASETIHNNNDDDDTEDLQLADMAEFADSKEAKAAIERTRKLHQFQNLFHGLVFFLNREVPREVFEFIICSFRGRIAWDGPGSPYTIDDPRITHHIIDRPINTGNFSFIDGREYVQPQWVADSINSHLLLPVAKYAPGAVLPPHLSPFVNDSAEGYIPAYREELDRLRAAAAVTGRLADILLSNDDKEEEHNTKTKSSSSTAKKKITDKSTTAEELDEDEEDDDDDEDEDDDEDDEDEDDDEDAEELLKAAESGTTVAKKPKQTHTVTSAEERRAMAASLLSNRQRKEFNRAVAIQDKQQVKITNLQSKRKEAEQKGETGTGSTNTKTTSTTATTSSSSSTTLSSSTNKKNGSNKRNRE